MTKKITLKRFDIFFGTGGVGKTTLATARALALAQRGHRVLLMTIDPAKRLKDILGLTDESSGQVCEVRTLEGVDLPTPINALLMNPKTTIAKMGAKAKVQELEKNRIVEVLTRPYGGMNEILSLIELKMQLEQKQYDCVVLDTPPGSHFLDFLDGIEKIRQFFDHRFVEIFTSIGKKAGELAPKNIISGFMDKVVELGVNKLLEYLQKVTGSNFVEDFLKALEVIYQSRSAFMKGLEMESVLLNQDQANWFLVTSSEQGKLSEALEIQATANKSHHRQMFLVLNKTLAHHLVDWAPEGRALKLKKHIINKEESLQRSKQFESVFEFPEILDASPIEHVRRLSTQWSEYAN
jgi:anion-transporting  ArsA/GET3 family ATPase